MSKKDKYEPDPIPEQGPEERQLMEESEFDPEFNDLPIEPTSYATAYKQAKKMGKFKKTTYQIHSWGQDDDEIIGMVVLVDWFKEGAFANEVKRYLIDTDQGRRSCILGSYTDNQLKDLDLVGKIVRIQYNGRKDLEGGRKVNLFDIEVLD